MKERVGIFIIALIVCLFMFVRPVHAADLQEAEGNPVAGQGLYEEEIAGQEADKDAKPAEPTEPTEPSEPSEPAEPTEPAKQVEPTEPAEQPVPTEQTEPAEPSEPAKDADAAPSVDSTTAPAPEAGPAVGEVPEATDTDTPEEQLPADSEQTDSIETTDAEDQAEASDVNTEKVVSAPASKKMTGAVSAKLAVAEKNVESTPAPVIRPLKDGVYVIVSKINGFKALQSEGGSAATGKAIELQECNGTNTQKFKLVSDASTGYYSITNVHSGKNLAVKGNAAKAGTAVVQTAASSALGQKWILVKKDGYYEIQSALDGSPLLLTLQNGSSANGTDAVLKEAKNAASQLFSFLVSKPSVTISDGVYEINTSLNSNMKLDVSNANMYDTGNLQIYQSNGSNAQKFIVTKLGGNKYTITSYNSGKAVELKGGSKSAGTNVQQYTKNGTAAQKWNIRNVGDGTLYITSAASGLPLEVKGGKAANKTNVYVNKASGSNAQKFTFKKIADSKVKPIANGVYLIPSVKNTDRVIAVEDASRLQGANIQLQYNDKASFQKFRFTYAGNGYYKIQNVRSKHVMDVTEGKYANKVNIRQWHDNGTLSQLWLPHKNSDGSYTFISAKSSRVLDAAGASTADCTNIWAYSFNNSAAQKFKLAKTSGSDSTAINYGTVKADSVLSAMCKKAQDYYSDTNYLVLANLTNHRLVLFKEMEGRWISVMNSPISIGKASTPTPTGTFYVYNHYKYFDGDYKDSRLTYQCWWSTCFYGSYYFHSVLYDYNSGYPGTIRDGRMCVNVSHGCVRMPLEKAEYLYDHSPIGTKVRVYK